VESSFFFKKLLFLHEENSESGKLQKKIINTKKINTTKKIVCLITRVDYREMSSVPLTKQTPDEVRDARVRLIY